MENTTIVIEGAAKVPELEGLGEVFSEEREGEEAKAGAGPADAVAVTVALDAARYDPALRQSTREYLDRQSQLLNLQINHFDVEHRLGIAAMRRRSLIDRLRISVQLLIATIGAAAVAGMAAMLWSAINDRSVVIDAFSVPAGVAEQGFTGEAVARQILDRLAELNKLSTTVRASNSYGNSLGGSLKLEIPETGVSLGELSHLLHERLGHITHVGGEVTHTGDELSVHIRIGDGNAVVSTGPQTSLASLVRDGATKVYAETQPYRYAYWLGETGDYAGAAAIFQRLAISGSRLERVWALHGLAIFSPALRDEVYYDQQALKLDPDFILSRMTLSEEYFSLGRDELGLKESQAVVAQRGVDSQSGLSRRGYADIRANATLDTDQELGDYQEALAAAGDLAEVADSEVASMRAWRSKIRALIYLHDRAAAAAAIALMPASSEAMSMYRSALLKAYYSVEQNDWRAVAADLEESRQHIGKTANSGLIPVYIPSLLAEAYARTGRDTEATATLATVPTDAYDGWCARGQVATVHHDYAKAGEAFAEAVRQGPSIPRAYFYWGQMLAEKGDIGGAMAKYAEANQRGPQWADPLKAWADVLVAQGRLRDALAKYDQALRRAPQWVELHAARDKAAQAMSKT